MKRTALVIAVGLILLATMAIAGEKEELTLKLEKALLTLNNAQLQFQVRMADDPGVLAAKNELNALSKEIMAKGYEIRQLPNGGFEVAAKPKPPEPAPPKAAGTEKK